MFSIGTDQSGVTNLRLLEAGFLHNRYKKVGNLQKRSFLQIILILYFGFFLA